MSGSVEGGIAVMIAVSLTLERLALAKRIFSWDSLECTKFWRSVLQGESDVSIS